MATVTVVEAEASGTTILVVEDNPTVRAVVTRALRESGHRVLEAADGLAALDIFAGPEKINLVVTDLLMPRMDGYQLAAHLGSSPQAPAVLFISGYGVSHEELPAPLLEKPFSPAELRAEVQRLLATGPASPDLDG